MTDTKNKTKYIFLIFGLALIFSFPVFLSKNGKEQGADTRKENKNISQVCFKNKCFNVEIADSLEEREKGLMNREYLDLDSGMLFLFDKKSRYSFWMENTLMPLDVIWIDESKKIVFIKENALPCKTENCELLTPGKEALYVLEINGGIVEKIGLKVGDVAEFK